MASLYFEHGHVSVARPRQENLMSQPLTSRSRQLLYIALVATVFSVLSISYKYLAGPAEVQSIANGNCVPQAEDVVMDDLCINFDSGVQFSSIKP